MRKEAMPWNPALLWPSNTVLRTVSGALLMARGLNKRSKHGGENFFFACLIQPQTTRAN